MSLDFVQTQKKHQKTFGFLKNPSKNLWFFETKIFQQNAHVWHEDISYCKKIDDTHSYILPHSPTHHA